MLFMAYVMALAPQYLKGGLGDVFLDVLLRTRFADLSGASFLLNGRSAPAMPQGRLVDLAGFSIAFRKLSTPIET
ncbi:hypothetical protein BZM26_30720 [Paraburkholderia strydomiana]|nr:hypothetical protein BZM26_30720 [Paraburkholderia strydomiana]